MLVLVALSPVRGCHVCICAGAVLPEGSRKCRATAKGDGAGAGAGTPAWLLEINSHC